MFVDSHCHLNHLKLEAGQTIDDVLQQARALQVSHVLTVCTRADEIDTLCQLATHDGVSMSVGVHPCDHDKSPLTADELLHWAKQPQVVALGETGLDYYWQSDDKAAQSDNFFMHLDVAKQVDKPVIVHTRAAKADTLAILKSVGREVSGVLHCFTEDWDMAKQALDLGWMISISGIVTFKKAEMVQSVAKQVPLDRLLIETDAPYLTPVPYRGKSNFPGYVAYVGAHVAQLRGMSVEKLAEHTTDNFKTLFFKGQPFDTIAGKS